MKHHLSVIAVALVSLLVAFAVQSAQAPANFVIPPDVPARYASNIRPAPSYIDARVLAANTAETHTMPSNTRFVLFSADCNFYVNAIGGTAAVPAADVTNGSASELNPAAYYWTTPPTTISIIAPTACVVTMAVYLGPVR